MNFENIELEVRKLHQEIWRHQDKLWPGKSLLPVQMLDIEALCSVLGVHYQEFDNNYTITRFQGRQYKAAGILDRQRKVIAVANNLSYGTARFTAAHEAGHWVLHPDQIMHRDRPIDGSDQLNMNRPRPEVEADHFAACYLMPRNLVVTYLEKRFDSQLPFKFDDHNAIWFKGVDAESLARADSDSLDREFALARCRLFNGHPFDSLAKTFGVSDSAMAVRLKKLKLIEWP